MNRPPRRSSLLPYTTLFRSLVVGTGFVYVLVGGPGLCYDDLVATALACAVASGIGLYVGSRRVGMAALRDRADRDRKSTRLNSSHANTSYALFCLKTSA